MAYFNNKEIRFKPRPIPSVPGVYPPDVPTPEPTESGSTPYIPTTFTGDSVVKFYITLSPRNKLTKELTNEYSTTVYFNDTSIINPVFEIGTNTDLSKYNYMYIVETQRYYYIDNVELYQDNVCKVYAVCDVLMSFKDGILNTVGIVDCTEKNSLINPNLPDVHYVNASGKNIKILEVDASSSSTVPGFEKDPHRILVVCGKTEMVTPGGSD